MKQLSVFEKILRRPFFIFSIFFFLSILTTGFIRSVSWAQEYPTREIKLIVPYAPGGGGVDFVARVFADKVEKILGVPVVVMNNTSGGGVVGTLSVTQAKPDGYTLLSGPTGLIITKPILTPEIPYNHTSFTPVCRTIAMPVGLFVLNDAPWKNLRELVDYGKKNPGKLRIIMGLAGGFLNVMASFFNAEAGIDITEIPTKGGGEVTTALLGGHVDLSMSTVASNIEFMRAGKVRALASTHKIPELPQLKTFEEEGYAGVSLKMWHGIFAPKELPKPILTKLTKAFEKACKDPSLTEKFQKLYILPDYGDPEEASKLIKNEYEITLKILKQSGIIK